MSSVHVAVAIDDDLDQISLISTILSQSGFDVVTALDGPAGIEAVRRHQPLLVTVDLDMPGIDGFETTRRIREFSNCFVLVVTSKQTEIDVVLSLGVGADGYVAKPLSPRAFRARVEALVRRPRAMVGGADRERPAAITAVAASTPSPPAEVAELVGSAPDVPQPPRMPPLPPMPMPVPPPPAPAPAPVDPVDPVEAAEMVEPAEADEPAEAVEPADAVAAVELDPVSEVATALEQASAVDPVPDADGPWIETRGLALQLSTGRVRIDGEGIDVSPEELLVLHALLTGARKVHSRAMIARLITATSETLTFTDRSAADAVVVSLLAKLGESRVRPRWIEAVSGIGYRRVAR